MNGVIVHGSRTGWFVPHAKLRFQYPVPSMTPPTALNGTPPDFRDFWASDIISLQSIHVQGPCQVSDGWDGAFIAFVEPGTHKQGGVPDIILTEWFHMYRRAFERWKKGEDQEKVL